MVERSLSMREAVGSMPTFSNFLRTMKVSIGIDDLRIMLRYKTVKTMRRPGIEPGPSAWKADILTTRPTTLL